MLFLKRKGLVLTWVCTQWLPCHELDTTFRISRDITTPKSKSTAGFTCSLAIALPLRYLNGYPSSGASSHDGAYREDAYECRLLPAGPGGSW